MESIWSKSVDFKSYEALNSDIECEAVVIGGGLAGLLNAYMLKKKGVEVVLIEGDKIANGNVSRTTGKVTLQHNLIYYKIIKEFGLKMACMYKDANEIAIETYKDIIKKENINCDFEEKDAYVYSTEDIIDILNEYEAAHEVGIRAELVDSIKLPIKIKKGIKFKNQGQFNPLKFLKGILKDLKIYEDTRAIEVDGNVVKTNRGNIKAKHIVVATHFPIINVPGYYFMKMHQDRSYILALENAENIDGVYIDCSKKGYSFRNYKDLLLIGGAGERTGENTKGGSFDELRRVAKVLYPNSSEVTCWSSQDCMTLDGLPYIGRYSDKTPNIYVATGFNKWGMTNAMVSAIIISDLIIGKDNEFNEVFSTKRVDISLSIPSLMKDGLKTATNFIAEKIHIPKEEINDVDIGEGRIISLNGEKVGVYRENEEITYAVTTKCPHLGCELKWNSDDLSWDCPCHGSRFDYKGKILDSPTTRGLTDENI